MKAIPFINVLLSTLVGYLKIVYSGLHWDLAKLYKIEGVENEARMININLSRLSLAIIILATISLAIGIICLKKQIPNHIIGFIVFLLALMGFVFSIVPI
jgi:hypothetical protein